MRAAGDAIGRHLELKAFMASISDRATRFVFNDDPECEHYANRIVNQFHVELRGSMYSYDAHRWAITNGFECLGSDGEWSHETTPSAREEDWKETHRFPRDTALRVAWQIEQKLNLGRTGARRLVNLPQDEYEEVRRLIRCVTLDTLDEIERES